jgi:hypothetical protein
MPEIAHESCSPATDQQIKLQQIIVSVRGNAVGTTHFVRERANHDRRIGKQFGAQLQPRSWIPIRFHDRNEC